MEWGEGGRCDTLIRRNLWIGVCFCLAVLLLVVADLSAQDADQQAKDSLIVETLQRLNRYDLSTVKPETRAAVLRHLDTHKGTPRYVELIESFNIRDRDDELLRLVLDKSEDPLGGQSAQLLLKFGQWEAVKSAINHKDDAMAVMAINAFSATQDAKVAELITTLIPDQSRSVAVRSAAVRGLARSPAGEKVLLEIVKAGKLPAELNFSAANALFTSRDESVRVEAGKHLQLPSTGGKPLPPVAELVRRQGNAANGPAVYAKATCITCHKAGDTGIDFGPALSEIGSKLSKEAIYTAILDPSAGISFGYEAFVVTPLDGAGLLGFIASQTPDQIVLKQMGGITAAIPRSRLKSLDKQPQSLMTPNLQLLMSEQELVDLVEYLATLKKK